MKNLSDLTKFQLEEYVFENKARLLLNSIYVFIALENNSLELFL
jgi:hypothetical protein